MKFTIKDIKLKSTTDSLILTFFVKDKPETSLLWKQLHVSDKAMIKRYFISKEFTAKEGGIKIIPRSPKGKIMLVGLGERVKWNVRQLSLISRQIVFVAKLEKIARLGISLESLVISGQNLKRVTQTVTENAIMANYDFLQYKQNKDNGFVIQGIEFLVSKNSLSSINAGIKWGQIIGEQINLARDLGNIPGGEMTPTLLAQKAQKVGKSTGVKVKILHKKEIMVNKMGAILGVAKGSAEEPKFIIMEYYGGKPSEAPYVFVGKGVTFDTGGLNLKPDKSMNDMHMDMLGGAAVICALGAIAQLKLPVNVIGLVPAVENMPGSAGYRPGDLLKSMSGKTIEVLNTDAEGRVILADALTYAEKYQPKLVIDVATLTGACMVALGLRCSGLMTPDTELQNKLQDVGEKSGDYVWPLPMWEEYEEEVKGTFGDVQNLGKSGYGGAITGAMFLWQFAKKYKWAHLDIAGPMKTIDGQYLSKGASGVGVRFLVELARS